MLRVRIFAMRCQCLGSSPCLRRPGKRDSFPGDVCRRARYIASSDRFSTVLCVHSICSAQSVQALACSAGYSSPVGALRVRVMFYHLPTCACSERHHPGCQEGGRRQRRKRGESRPARHERRERTPPQPRPPAAPLSLSAAASSRRAGSPDACSGLGPSPTAPADPPTLLLRPRSRSARRRRTSRPSTGTSRPSRRSSPWART